MNKQKLITLYLLLATALILGAGCVPTRYKMPTQSEMAIIYNDAESGVYIQFVESNGAKGQNMGSEYVKALKGTQEITFGYYKRLNDISYLQDVKPLVITETLLSGHRYQVIGYTEMGFSAIILDITTQEDVWKYYEKGLNAYHQSQAVRFLSDSDQEKLIYVYQNNPKPVVRIEAVKKIRDSNFLAAAIKTEIDSEVRNVIEKRLRALK